MYRINGIAKLQSFDVVETAKIILNRFLSLHITYLTMFEIVKQTVTEIISNSHASKEVKLQSICDLLRKEIPYYDWVGFYFHKEDENVLELAQYSGNSTDHTIIPFGKGICGQVALSNQNFVVPDVKAQDNYIACSLTVKSEIVIPIFVNGKNIGQIDIDSETLDPFTAQDELFLEWVCQQVSNILIIPS